MCLRTVVHGRGSTLGDAEFLWVADCAKELVYDILLSDSDSSFGTTSSGASYKPMRECLMTSALEAHTASIDDPK
jgi:hypothetical protein